MRQSLESWGAVATQDSEEEQLLFMTGDSGLIISMEPSENDQSAK